MCNSHDKLNSFCLNFCIIQSPFNARCKRESQRAKVSTMEPISSAKLCDVWFNVLAFLAISQKLQQEKNELRFTKLDDLNVYFKICRTYHYLIFLFMVYVQYKPLSMIIFTTIRTSQAMKNHLRIPKEISKRYHNQACKFLFGIG